MWGTAIGAALGYLSPALLAGQLRRRRLEAFQAQLPDTFVLVANSLKAGFSFLQALEMVAREAAAPSSDEFRKVAREINLGVSVEEALNSLTRRMPAEDLELAVAAILIQRQMGGNLSELLEVIATTIRDRIRIQGHLKSATAQGRLTGVVVALLPVGLGAIMTILSPEFIRPLLTEPVGRVLLAGALGLELVGAWVIRRICVIDF
ncbi:MAG: type II secretion system F family protein [Firmicutes bacterium]|nr:type II secretion system F family protein [Bacillota bacterium]